MFRSLIKVNNDGILISQDENILFYNDKIKYIFHVTEKLPNNLLSE